MISCSTASSAAVPSVIAAASCGRRCYGIEIDPQYVDTIVRRWQAFAGEEARHASSGKAFKELEEAK